ncbi:protein kinase domain-containing protein [Clostridium sp. DJ247]|uniref:protein kinase domain-containing protein n=1 Tax=Clostridium sp. DJ247 TaxID=2726188 RepID=UPI00162A8C93|nr:protein kinase [Clostridium sp. DJ247]MBC2579859.1 protein kinase [Clostridium sp. DJ247]
MSRYKFSNSTILSDEGGMGITWRGIDDHLKRDVVIKTIKREMLSKSQFTLDELNKQLIDEAINQAKVTHENIAKVYDYYINPGDKQVYLVFEYINGKGLDKYPDLIKCESKNLNELLNIFEQILKGIICAHKNNIIHRDIKLNNIMYSRNSNHIKIIDFGISKVKQANTRSYTVNMYGCAPFYAPERFHYKNLKVDNEEKFDIYALGVTFFYMLTGDYPYKVDKGYDAITPRVSDFRNDVNEELDELICAMIQVNPENRLGDLSVVLESVKRHQKIIFKNTTNIPYFKAENQIRDALHDYISVTDDELKIINHPVFQRLRNINQLGTTYLVYPGATHTRFSHSLGVMHLATRIFDEMVIKNSTEIQWDYKEIKKQRQMLRIASLLHDCGHGPFSHVSDNLFANEVDNHEKMAGNLIKNTKLSEIIDNIGSKNCGFNHKEIAGLIEGKNSSRYSLIKRIFSGNIIDADRMDYLLRDSLMLGVKYGKYDIEHLIRSMNIDFSQGDYTLAIEKKGIYALEEFMLARHFMFTQVYMHKTRRIYDRILERCLQCMLPSNILPIREDEFLQWDDHRVLEYIRNNPNTYNEMFLNRGHLKLIYEKVINYERDDRIIINEIRNRIRDKRYKDTEVIVDYEIQNPITYVDEMGKPIIRILDKDRTTKDVGELSPLLININKPIEILRIYGTIEKQIEILRIIEEVV